MDMILWAAYNNVNLDDPRIATCDDFKEDMEAAIPRVLPLDKEHREIVVMKVSGWAHATIS